MKPAINHKIGKRHKFDDIEFWAEEGVICIEDQRNGDVNAVNCKEFGKRADVINEEARRATYQTDKIRLQNIVLEMYEVWQEAKEQGDPTLPDVMKKKLKEHRRAIMTTGLIW